MKLSGNVEGSVELNQNTLRTCGLSKGSISGIANGIKLKLLGNGEGEDPLIKRPYV